MSFILDALKKSEAERQKNNTPGIANIPESGGKRTASTWAWIIGVLLSANLAALGYIVLKPGQNESPAGAEQPITAVSADTVADTEALAEPPSVQPARTAARSASPPVESSPEEPQSQPVIPEPEPATASLPTVADGLANFTELRARGVLQLPDLHLDIHVYSGTPAERFVFVNMSKYTENSTLEEGPTVVEITPDGVVLDYLGTAFLLPRE